MYDFEQVLAVLGVQVQIVGVFVQVQVASREEAHALARVDAFVLSLPGFELACMVQVGRRVDACPLLDDEEARNVQKEVEGEAGQDEPILWQLHSLNVKPRTKEGDRRAKELHGD